MIYESTECFPEYIREDTTATREPWGKRRIKDEKTLNPSCKYFQSNYQAHSHLDSMPALFLNRFNLNFIEINFNKFNSPW